MHQTLYSVKRDLSIIKVQNPPLFPDFFQSLSVSYKTNVNIQFFPIESKQRYNKYTSKIISLKGLHFHIFRLRLAMHRRRSRPDVHSIPPKHRRTGRTSAPLSCEQLCEFTLVLKLCKLLMRSEKRIEKCLLNISQTDCPCCNTVDRSVKIVRCNEYTVKRIMRDDFLCDFLCLVVKKNNMVAVPADRACDMECDLLIEKKQRGNLIGNDLCRVI